MIAMAYGASFHTEDDQFSESITDDMMYIKTINCKESNALERIINYHRKCIALAINKAYVSSHIQKINPSLELLLTASVNIAYKDNPSEIVIYIRSFFIESNTYLKHQFNLIGGGYFSQLYMAL